MKTLYWHDALHGIQEARADLRNVIQTLKDHGCDAIAAQLSKVRANLTPAYEYFRVAKDKEEGVQ